MKSLIVLVMAVFMALPMVASATDYGQNLNLDRHQLNELRVRQFRAKQLRDARVRQFRAKQLRDARIRQLNVNNHCGLYVNNDGFVCELNSHAFVRDVRGNRLRASNLRGSTRGLFRVGNVVRNVFLDVATIRALNSGRVGTALLLDGLRR